MFEFFQADQDMRVATALPDDVGSGGVVSDAIDPGAQRATRVPACETAPEREVNLLEQVAAMVGVGLVGPSQPLERRAVSGGGLAVSVVLRSFHS